MIQIPNTVNVDIFALLNFRALSSRRHIPMVIFSHKYQIILFVLSLLSYFLLTSNFAHLQPCTHHATICAARTFLHLSITSQKTNRTICWLYWITIFHKEKGQSLSSDMSAVATNCVTDPLRWFCASLCEICKKRAGILM